MQHEFLLEFQDVIVSREFSAATVTTLEIEFNKGLKTITVIVTFWNLTP